MNNRMIRKLFLASLPLAALLLAFGLSVGSEQPAQEDNVLALQAPGFVKVARADTSEVTDFPTDEVGMSAWFEASSSIDLNTVRDAFRTIEDETEEYIIGSVPVGAYPESEDVHVYVHNASHLMLIVDWTEDGSTDDFEINLPGTFSYYERSWSLGASENNAFSNGAEYTVDDVTIYSVGGSCGSFCTSQGTLTASQMLPDQFHTVGIWAGVGDYGYAGLALVYGEQ